MKHSKPVAAMAAFAIAAATPLFGYVPEPQPVKSAVEITALYYPGTAQKPEFNI